MPFKLFTQILILLLLHSVAYAGDFPVADKVIIEKAERKLHLMKDGEVFRTFDIALGIRPTGDKESEGDFRTPEGDYLLDWRRDGNGLRYVHHFNEEELAALASDSGFSVLETFNSDGESGNLGLYQVWRPS